AVRRGPRGLGRVRPSRCRGEAGGGLRDSRPLGRARRRVAPARSARAGPAGNAAPARAPATGRLPALRHGRRTCGEGLRGGGVTAGVVAALGLAVVIAGRGRPLRFAGLAAWLAGSSLVAR